MCQEPTISNNSKSFTIQPTVANILTIFRIVLVPIFLVILLTEMQNKRIIAFIIFVIAAVTDSLDGYVARKFNQVSDLGKFLDPLADKLLVSAALIALVYLQEVETWVASVIILREIFITAYRFYFLMHEGSFSASIPAKLKTLTQIVGIALIILYSRLPYSHLFFKLGTYVLYIAVFLSVYSGIEYLFYFQKKVKK